MRSNQKQIPLRQSLYLFLSLVTLIILGSGFLFFSQVDQHEKQVGNLLRHLAWELLREIPSESHRSIRNPEDVESAAFQQIRRKIRDFAKRQRWPKENIYTYQFDENLRKQIGSVQTLSGTIMERVRAWLPISGSLQSPKPSRTESVTPSGDTENSSLSSLTLTFAVMGHEQPFIGKRANVDPAVWQKIATLQSAQFPDGEEVVLTDRYLDQHGHWISALSSLKDSAGELTGILVIDYRLDLGEITFYQDLEKIIIVSLFIALVLSILFYRKYRSYLHWSNGLSQLGRNRDSQQAEYKRIKKIFQESVDNKDSRGAISRSLLEILDEYEFLREQNMYLPPVVRENLHRKHRMSESESSGSEKEMVVLALHIGISGDAMQMYDKTGKMTRIAQRVYGDFLKATEHGKGEMERATGSLLLGYFQGPNASLNAVKAAMEMISGLDAYWDRSVGSAMPAVPSPQAPEGKSAGEKNTDRKSTEREQGIRMGISMGPIVVTEVQNKKLRDVIHWGDDIEIAIRFAFQAEAFELLFSDVVFNDVFDYSELPKGFKITEKGEAKTVFHKKKMKIYSIRRVVQSETA